MKKLSAILIVLLFAGAAAASAQVVPGKFELGTSISFNSIKFDNDTSSTSYLNVPVRLGWYFWQGLELEPEVQIFVPTGSGGDNDVTYFLQGKLLYNFRLSGVEPFIGGGAGIGNGLSFLGMVEGFPDLKTFAYLGMAGLKFHLGNSAAIRLEYRFNRFSWQEPLALKEWGNYHQVFVGISLFL